MAKELKVSFFLTEGHRVDVIWSKTAEEVRAAVDVAIKDGVMVGNLDGVMAIIAPGRIIRVSIEPVR